MRTAAIVLAAVSAIGQLALFAYGEAQLDVTLLGQMGGTVDPWWSRAAWAAVWATPWLVGGGLLLGGHGRVGTAVIVAVAVLAIPELVGAVDLAATTADGSWQPDRALVAGGVALVWLTGAVAGLAAWRSRPRDGWRLAAPCPGGVFTLAAIAAWLPTAFHSTAFAPPGAPRRFVEPHATGFDLGSMESIVAPAMVALVLLVAPRLRPAVAGGVTLTFGLPHLLSQAATLRADLPAEHVIPTPAGVVGPIGAVVLVAVGVVWLRRGRRAVSDAATDRDPHQAV